MGPSAASPRGSGGTRGGHCLCLWLCPLTPLLSGTQALGTFEALFLPITAGGGGSQARTCSASEAHPQTISTWTWGKESFTACEVTGRCLGHNGDKMRADLCAEVRREAGLTQLTRTGMFRSSERW